MMSKVFAVYDSKIGSFMAPFFMPTKGHALRAFENLVNDPNTTVCKYPSDFTLFELGEFDDQSGALTLHEAKISLGLALEFVRKPIDQAPLLSMMQGQVDKAGVKLQEAH